MIVSLLTVFRQIFAICLLSLFVTGSALADSPIAPVNTEHGLAIKGYDPVSYFTSGKPTPGLAQFSTTYKGATYRFVSAENRDRFLAATEKLRRLLRLRDLIEQDRGHRSGPVGHRRQQALSEQRLLCANAVVFRQVREHRERRPELAVGSQAWQPVS